MQLLKSYLQDAWVAGAEPQTPLLNATTGQPCAQTSSRGLDLGAALHHARQVGGANLRRRIWAALAP